MKKLEDLKIDDIVWIYAIISLPEKESITKINAKVYRLARDKSSVSVYENFNSENPIRHVLKMNEGNVYRNMLWLAEEDDELAEKILIEFLYRKIKIFENNVKHYHTRINLVRKFFNSGKFDPKLFNDFCPECGGLCLRFAATSSADEMLRCCRCDKVFKKENEED